MTTTPARTPAESALILDLLDHAQQCADARRWGEAEFFDRLRFQFLALFAERAADREALGLLRRKKAQSGIDGMSKPTITLRQASHD